MVRRREGNVAEKEREEGEREGRSKTTTRERKGGTGSWRVGLGCRRVRGSELERTGGGGGRGFEGRPEENWNPE